MKHVFTFSAISLVVLLIIGIFGFTPEQQAGKVKPIASAPDSYVVNHEIGGTLPYATGVEPWDLKGKTVTKTEYYTNCVKLTFSDGYTLEVKSPRTLNILVKDKANSIESKDLNKIH